MLTLAVKVLQTVRLNELDLCIESDSLLELVMNSLGELLKTLDLIREYILGDLDLNFERISIVDTIDNEHIVRRRSFYGKQSCLYL